MTAACRRREVDMKATVELRLAWALVLLGAGCGGEPSAASEEEVVDESDAGAQLERTERQDLSLSSCGQALLTKYKDSPYVPLVRWNTSSTSGAVGNRDFMTTDQRWYGCTGESRTDEYGFGDTYYFQGVVGLLYRPDRTPPSGTVAVYGYESSVRGTGGTTNWPEVHRDRCISTDMLPPTISGAPTARYGLLRTEGYALSWSYRPVSGDGAVAFYALNKTSTTGSIYDCYNDTTTTAPAGFTVTNLGLNGYVKTEASVTVVPTGGCSLDTDCAATQLCYWKESVPGTNLGTRGVCTPRCLSNAQCSGDYPVCDIEAQRCAQSPVDYRGSAATFTRASVASYQTASNRLSWASNDQLRYDDRGDGFGSQPLLEQAATNGYAVSNDITLVGPTTWWSNSSQTTSLSTSDTPGPHNGSLFKQTVANALPLLNPVGGAAGAAQYSVSLWSKAQAYTGTYTYVDLVNVVGGTQVASVPSADWRRISLVGTFDPTVVGNVRIQAASTMPLTDAREIAYVQLESGTYPSTAIYTSGASATRAADSLSVSLKDVSGTAGFSWRFYVWPEFSCDDLRTSVAVPNAKAIRWADNVGERTYVQFNGAGSTCNVTLWNGSWATPANTITNLSWQRDQLLIIQISSSASGTTFRVLGSISGDKSLPANAGQITWTNLANLQPGSTGFSGRVSPPVITSGDTSSTGVYGPPALMNLVVTTTTNQASFAFDSNEHVQSYIDWGIGTTNNTTTGGQGTRQDGANGTGAVILSLASATTYTYRVRLVSTRTGDNFVSSNMTFTTK
jgi:hypothetical protein